MTKRFATDATDMPEPRLAPSAKKTAARLMYAVFIERAVYLAFCGVLIVTVYYQSIQPAPLNFVTFDGATNQIVTVRPGSVETTDKEVLVKNYLRQYVRNRETIDHTTDDRRRVLVELFTNPDWFAVWDEMMRNIDGSGILARYRREGLSREIRDITVQEIPGLENRYRAEYTTIDRYGADEYARGRWMAQIEIAFEPIRGPQNAIDHNPLGLTVYTYIISEVAGS